MPMIQAAAAQAKQSDWTSLPQSELVYMQLDTGLVVIHLSQSVAPKHVAQFSSLVKSRFYDNSSFYRVIDGFVAQAGKAEEKSDVPTLPPEFTRTIPTKSDFISVQSPAFFADEAGFINAFAAGKDNETKEEWLIHCPGALAMARGTAPNSATSDFYIVIGQAPRHLDRNMSIFGRVVYGMEHVQKIKRASLTSVVSQGGVISDKAKQTKIKWAKLGDELPNTQQLTLAVQNVAATPFQQRLQDAKSLKHEFYVYPGSSNIDVCYYQPKIKVDNI